MKWMEAYPKEQMPSFAEIGAFVGTECWNELHSYLQNTYGVQPKIEHSICSGAPGWNVKYKKGGRSLCVFYPDEGVFTCLVCIGAKEAPEAELLLGACTPYVQELYQHAQPLNGSRWLMIRVTAGEIVEDAKKLIATRVQKK